MATTRQRLSYLAEQFIINALLNAPNVTAIVGTRIYPISAPLKTVFPCIIVQKVPSNNDGDNIIPMGNRRIGARYVFRVKASDKSTSRDAVVLLAREIGAALNGIQGVIGTPALNVTNVQEVREFSLPVLDQGTWYQQEGGEYRVYIDGN